MTQPTPDFEAMATALINEYPYDERARLRDGITKALRQAYQAGLLEAAELAYEAFNKSNDLYYLYTEDVCAVIRKRAASLGGSK